MVRLPPPPPTYFAYVYSQGGKKYLPTLDSAISSVSCLNVISGIQSSIDNIKMVHFRASFQIKTSTTKAVAHSVSQRRPIHRYKCDSIVHRRKVIPPCLICQKHRQEVNQSISNSNFAPLACYKQNFITDSINFPFDCLCLCQDDSHRTDWLVAGGEDPWHCHQPAMGKHSDECQTSFSVVHGTTSVNP